MVDLSLILAPRSLDDMLAERVRVRLGGETYTLRVKTMRAQREWEETLDVQLVRLLQLVQSDGDDVEALIRALSESAWPFIDLLVSYDAEDVLPDRDTIDSTETEMGLLIALLEVWRAGHPKADIGLGLFALRNLMLDPEWRERMSSAYPSGVSHLVDYKPN